jgi:hypothetical protein
MASIPALRAEFSRDRAKKAGDLGKNFMTEIPLSL